MHTLRFVRSTVLYDPLRKRDGVESMQKTDGQQATSPAWVSLRLKLATSQTVEELAALRDTIERHGIFKQGDFDRPEKHPPGSTETAWAVELVRVPSRVIMYLFAAGRSSGRVR